MLLALEERQSRIEVGYGLEGRLTDGKTGRIQDDYMIPYYKNNDFDNGILNGYKALYDEVCQEYNIESDAVPIRSASTTTREHDADFRINDLPYIILMFVHFMSSVLVAQLIHEKKRFFVRLKWLVVWAVVIFAASNLFIFIFDQPYAFKNVRTLNFVMYSLAGT